MGTTPTTGKKNGARDVFGLTNCAEFAYYAGNVGHPHGHGESKQMIRALLLTTVFVFTASSAQAATLSSLLGLDEALEAAIASADIGGVSQQVADVASTATSGSTAAAAPQSGSCCAAQYSCCNQPMNGGGNGNGGNGNGGGSGGGGSTINISIDINIDIDIVLIGSYSQPSASVCVCR